MPEVQATIFDLSGTLWHWPRRDPTRDGPWFWGHAHDHALRTLPPSHGLVRVERETFAAAMVAAEAEYRRRARTQGRSRTPQDVAVDGLRRLGVRAGNAGVSAVLDGYRRAAVGWPAPFPDARPALRRLRDGGYRLAVLSNTWWPARWLDEDLHNLGLVRLFDEILYTSGLSHAKPHGSVFLEARRLDTDPAACVMVGDDPYTDVAGARNAGMRTVWRRNGRPDAELGDATPDATVDGLFELPGLLRRDLW